MPKHYRERIQPLGMISARVSDDGTTADLDLGVAGRVYCLGRQGRAALRKLLDRIDLPPRVACTHTDEEETYDAP